MARVIKAGQSDPQLPFDGEIAVARTAARERSSAGASASGAVLNLTDLTEEARRIVLEARQEAARVIAQSQTVADSEKRKAMEKGFADGFARGRAEGLAAGREEGAKLAADQARGELAKLVELGKCAAGELRSARCAVVDSAKRTMLEFAIQLARKIVAEVAVRDASTARANLSKALSRLDGAGSVIAYVNPSQLAALEHHASGFLEALGGEGVRLVGDERVAAGGVRVAHRDGQIDATIDTQLDNVVEALLGRSDAGQYVAVANERV